jgi:hypothetical protein
MKRPGWIPAGAGMTAVLLLVTASAVAGEPTGAAFLKIGAGARAVGMGSAYTAMADDAAAAYWNPAGLGRLGEREVSASHAEWLGDVRYDNVTLAVPLTRTSVMSAGSGKDGLSHGERGKEARSLGTLAGSVAALTQGDMEGRSADRRRQGDFAARDTAAAVSYGHRAGGMAWGVSAKLIEQRLAGETAAGAAFDLGWQQDLGRRARAGLTVLNAGPRMSFVEEKFHLPLTAAAGVSVELPQGLRIGVELRRLVYDRRSSLSVGTEYLVWDRIALRGGLSERGEGMYFGFGLNVARYRVDYAMTPDGELGGTQRLTLSARF